MQFSSVLATANSVGWDRIAKAGRWGIIGGGIPTGFAASQPDEFTAEFRIWSPMEIPVSLLGSSPAQSDKLLLPCLFLERCSFTANDLLHIKKASTDRFQEGKEKENPLYKRYPNMCYPKQRTSDRSLVSPYLASLYPQIISILMTQAPAKEFSASPSPFVESGVRQHREAVSPLEAEHGELKTTRIPRRAPTCFRLKRII